MGRETKKRMWSTPWHLERGDGMSSWLRSITVDCRDALVVGRFWAEALGWSLEDDSEPDDALVTDPSGRAPRLLFLRVPEPKIVKNRVHLDIRAESSMAEEVARLEALGAIIVREVSEDEDDVFTVMQDPEGNEFCVERSEAERPPS
jgi:predicted enzyme related to lactoylglutathione lyase